jgi:hypothetical protein
MRLLHASTFSFDEFFDDEIPEYAILSHTWGEEEVTFQDILAGRTVFQNKKGFKKIQFCARKALQQSIEFVWVDTCCIDKSSSAELTEAINSMYRWYQKAEWCYVYLAGVPHPPANRNDFASEPEASQTTWKAFEDSRWFTRGWTLQELIAPARVIFYSEDGKEIGRKRASRRGKFMERIAAITNISVEVLGDSKRMNKICVAERMSWASRRKTSRGEDIAYSLMGIFGVNMPLLYGEGREKAFIRLQKEILQQSDDHTIFAWRDPSAAYSTFRGLLASSPAAFEEGHKFEKRIFKNEIDQHYNMTNKGLHISLYLKTIENSGETEHVAYLNCRPKPSPGEEADVVGLYLKNMGLSINPSNQFMRIDPSKFYVEKDDNFLSERLTELYIPQTFTVPEGYRTSRVTGFYIGHIKSYSRYFLEATWPPGAWDSRNGVFRICEPGKMIYIRALFVPKMAGIGRVREEPRVLCLKFNGSQTAITSSYSHKTLEPFEYSGAAYFVSWDYSVDADPVDDAAFQPGAWRVKLSDLEFQGDELVIPVTLHLR